MFRSNATCARNAIKFYDVDIKIIDAESTIQKTESPTDASNIGPIVISNKVRK